MGAHEIALKEDMKAATCMIHQFDVLILGERSLHNTNHSRMILSKLFREGLYLDAIHHATPNIGIHIAEKLMSSSAVSLSLGTKLGIAILGGEYGCDGSGSLVAADCPDSFRRRSMAK